MLVFDQFNRQFGDVCPICKTNEDCETVLIKVRGTENDGVCHAKQYHLKCLDLWVDEDCNIIYQNLNVR